MSTNNICKHGDEVERYVMGEMEPEARANYERHLSDCPVCTAEVRSLSTTLEAFADSLPSVEPPTRVLDELRRRVRDEPRPDPGAPQVASTPPSVLQGITFALSGAGDFFPTPIPGIAVRPLFIDKPNSRVTLLMRLEAGAVYPSHGHRGTEECYVIEGKVTVGDRILGPGDYQFAEAGSDHPPQTSEEGCLLLIGADLADHPRLARMA